MNKKLPFEEWFERQMNNLPSPNEDESWQKMKQLLDDNDKRVPLVFSKSYKIWGVLVLLLLTGLWLIIHSANTSKEKQVTTSMENADILKRPLSDSLKARNKTQSLKLNVSGAVPKTVKDNQVNASVKSTSVISTKKTIFNSPMKTDSARESSASSETIVLKDNRRKENNLSAGKQISVEETGITHKKRSVADKEPDIVVTESSLSSSSLQKNYAPVNIPSIIQSNLPDIFISQRNSLFHKEDTAAKENTASKKVALQKFKKYFVSAGLGVQQQIPLAGQQIVHYGYNGKNSFSDYIPSIYFRFERDQKWFLQGEFIYGAPQLLKQFTYSRQTQTDTSGTVSTTTLRLKKTFYNEIPVSFNYYILPAVSAGVGMTYSWLHGAIAEKEIKTYDTQTSSVVQQVVPIAGYTDSFLYKSHTYLMLQTDYSWRKLSLGLRYTRDLEPYIKYTLPDGTIADQRNWSLQFILRFRLFKSGNF